MEPTPRHVQRIAISLLTAGGLVVGGFVAAAPTGTGRGDLPSTYDAQARERAERARRAAAAHPPRRHDRHRPRHRARVAGDGHVHDDPSTKNAVSRSGEAAAAPDRTTPRQRAASLARVAEQRTQREPRLTGVPLRSRRRAVPESVYAMAGGCYRLAGSRLTFQATGLGSYLLYAPDRTFLAASGTDGAGLRDRAVAARGLDRDEGRQGPVHLHPRRRPLAAEGGRRPGHGGGRGLRAASYDRVRRIPRGRHQRAAAARSVASRPSRRSAAGSTRTSTGRPTSSSAAA